MKYMGSKNRHAKDILPIILRDRKHNQWYVEPFVGGFNMIDKVDGNRLANDSHEYLIALFDAVQNGWLPPRDISEQTYKDIQANKNAYAPSLVGYVGFALSYGGKFFGGYRRDSIGKRNYSDEAYRGLLKQIPHILGIHLRNQSYLDLEIPPKSIVYCDPPYANTTKYRDDFNHEEFWKWVRKLLGDGHQVFISEYTAPKDFVPVWSKIVNNTLAKETGSKQGTEHLFTYVGYE